MSGETVIWDAIYWFLKIDALRMHAIRSKSHRIISYLHAAIFGFNYKISTAYGVCLCLPVRVLIFCAECLIGVMLYANQQKDLVLGEGVMDERDSTRLMMTSSNGHIFRVTGNLCGDFTGHRWIPRTNASDAELWCFLWSAPEWTVD